MGMLATLLAVLSAALTAASFSLPDYGWLIWFGLAPLMLALYLSPSPPFSFLLGTFWSLLWLVPSLMWLRNFGPLAVGLTALFLCFAYGVFALFTHHVLRRFSLPWVIVAVSGFFLTQEYMHELGAWGFPWFKLAYTQANFPLLYQSANIAGAALLSLLIMVANLILFYLLVRPSQLIAHWRAVILWAGVFGLNLLYGWWHLSTWEPPPDARPLTVAAIQGGTSSLRDWAGSFASLSIAQYANLTDEVLARWQEADPIELVVMPETSIPVTIGLPSGARTPPTIALLARRYRTGIIFGAMSARHLRELLPLRGGENSPRPPDFFGSEQDLDSWVSITPGREVTRKDGTRGRYAISTSLIALDEEGDLADYHHKVMPVPFGETVPLGGRMRFLHFPWGSYDLSAGRKLHPLRVGELRVGGLICFSSVFPFVSRAEVLGGAELIALGTNNSWYLKEDPENPDWVDPIGKVGVLQHANIDRFIAVQTGRYLVRAATTGVSHIIDPRGVVIESSRIGPAQVVVGRVYRLSDLTFWVRWGNWLYGLAALTALVSLLYLGITGESEAML